MVRKYRNTFICVTVWMILAAGGLFLLDRTFKVAVVPLVKSISVTYNKDWLDQGDRKK